MFTSPPTGPKLLHVERIKVADQKRFVTVFKKAPEGFKGAFASDYMIIFSLVLEMTLVFCHESTAKHFFFFP